ncbi:AAA family ATPase [Cupriavidus sp. IK-TO18]|uniref:AAA family ATPase n=1 Tax=Cupriavidus sp. IK-TO18 TaxID=2782182 RepID=UPI001898717C|nr:AAA family ATPase [Cupriavidus sp. IK-TO18]MBF6990934.1 AAA family ATPase [Cupriavidus sp. IK-TO18]
MLNRFDEGRARSALFALDAGCAREEWVRLGMAAKDAGLGFDDFHAWSQGAANYGGERECLAAWKSFESGPVKAASLFRAALDAGWEDPGKTRHSGPQAARVPSPRPRVHPEPKAAQKPRIDLSAVFDGYPPADASHPYIVCKRGTPDGLRVVPQDDPLTIRGQSVAGSLVVPVRSLDGELLTVQYIPPPGAGNKLNAAGASFGNGLLVVGDVVPDGRVYVCEGIGQAWAVARADYHAAAAVAFGCGRFHAVGRVLRERFPSARLVFVADRGKEAQAEAIAREVCGAWVEMPADKPENYDANDYEAECGSDALADLLASERTPPTRYRLQSAEDLLAAPALRWLVRGVLPADGLAALYGPSGSGKSFLALDLCAAIADGSGDWFGRRVSTAPVTYCALEGERGMGKRAKAWSARHGRRLPGRLMFVTQPIDLRDGQDVADLGAAVLAAGGGGGLLVIDTLNRAAPGADENASTDMGEIIAACKELQARIGGLVMLVHHTGKDGAKGLRGHSSLYAALDAAIEVSRDGARREWSIAKSKDDEDGERSAFSLRVTELGEDEHGDPVTSCVVERDGGTTEVSRVKLPQGGNQRLALNALAEPLRQARDFGKGDAPPGFPCLELEAAVLMVADSLTCEPKRQKERAREAITGLVARGVYGVKDGWLWRR